ncbi:sel1 repeat family protein [Oxalobacteraceae sp. CFBP 13730]|nr:sel1 repeat family protein [Oxalobacteraceae sp. CFBP 13730]
MANREELAIIRNARAGQAAAQLALGKLYLFGSSGLPQSLPTALHWLERAARQDCPPAWQLIGNHIPLELAQRDAAGVSQWYERAYDDGSVHAGLVFAQLVLDPLAPVAQQSPKAVRALEDAARAGFSHAQMLLTQQHKQVARAVAAPATAARTPAIQGVLQGGRPASRPASRVQHTSLDALWFARRWADYLRLGLPQARALVDEFSECAEPGELRRFAPDEIALLSRCARLLDPALIGLNGLNGLDGVDGVDSAAPDRAAPGPCDPGELAVFWELAAAEHDPYAQLALGLRSARMRVDGQRFDSGDGHAAHVANFKRAIRWLMLAGEQGLAEAWYALSRIYIKPEFSQRNVADAQCYLERAAGMGYRAAQVECGHNAWRARRENENNDVRAVYWLQKAAEQGAPDAPGLLHKIAPRLHTTPYTETGALLALHAGALAAHPLLAARLELAQVFNLSRPEALLLDVVAADQGHCLVIDIRASYGRSKRRLVMVASGPERQALDRIVRLFDAVDCGPAGPEGNYRQRLYRLRTLLNIVQPDSDNGAGAKVELVD